jgi:hypothetical protein
MSSVLVETVAPPLDHLQRLEVARQVSSYLLGETGSADDIIGAYFAPTSYESWLDESDLALGTPSKMTVPTEQSLPADISPPAPDHAQRLLRAREVAYYQLGLESCADDILGAYFAPSQAIFGPRTT